MKVPTLLFLFFFFFLILCGVIFKSVLVLGKKHGSALVSIAAVFRLIMQPLRDEPKNGFKGD